MFCLLALPFLFRKHIMAEKKKKKVKKEVSTADFMIGLSDDFAKAGFLGDKEELQIMPAIFPSFNRASLIGGLPSACICEFHGPNQGGKTALSLGLLVSAQKHGHLVGFVDAEGGLKNDKDQLNKWPASLGLSMKKGEAVYVLGRKKSFEEVADKVCDSIDKFLKVQASNPSLKDKWFLWVIDSLTSLVPKDELEGSIGQRNFGLQAALASRWLKKLNNQILGSNITIIFINQERSKMNAGTFEKKWKSACGEALQYYAHFRARIARAEKIKIGTKPNEVHAGWKHRFIIEKNKISACDETGYFFTSTGRHESMPLGWDMARCYVEEGIIQGIVERHDSKVFCDYNAKTIEGMQISKLIKLIKENQAVERWFLQQFDERQGNGSESEEANTNKPETEDAATGSEGTDSGE